MEFKEYGYRHKVKLHLKMSIYQSPSITKEVPHDKKNYSQLRNSSKTQYRPFHLLLIRSRHQLTSVIYKAWIQNLFWNFNTAAEC